MKSFWIALSIFVIQFPGLGSMPLSKKGHQWEWLDCAQHCSRCEDAKLGSCGVNETFYYDGDPCGCCDACVALSDVGEPCLHAMVLQKTTSLSRVVVSTRVCREGLICSKGLCIARQKTPCNSENIGLSYISRCDSRGFFMPLQCSASHCWCVNRFSGKPIAESKRPWDYYWVHLDAKFGCPPQTDLNHLLESEEEDGSRWRRDIDQKHFYFPGYKKIDGSIRPITELQELQTDFGQLKYLLDKLSKEDVQLIKYIIHTDLKNKQNSLEQNLDTDYNTIPTPKTDKEIVTHHLIHSVLNGPSSESLKRLRRDIPENSERGKIVLEMKIDCPETTTTTTTIPPTTSTTTSTTTITPSEANSNETSRQKTKKRKPRRKKTRVTRSITLEEEESKFQKFLSKILDYLLNLYQSFIDYSKYYWKKEDSDEMYFLEDLNDKSADAQFKIDISEEETTILSNNLEKNKEDFIMPEKSKDHIYEIPIYSLVNNCSLEDEFSETQEHFKKENLDESAKELLNQDLKKEFEENKKLSDDFKKENVSYPLDNTTNKEITISGILNKSESKENPSSDEKDKDNSYLINIFSLLGYPKKEIPKKDIKDEFNEETSKKQKIPIFDLKNINEDVIKEIIKLKENPKDDIYEKDILYLLGYPMEGTLNLDCRGLKRKECEKHLYQLLHSLTKSNLQKRSIKSYKYMSQFSNEDDFFQYEMGDEILDESVETNLEKYPEYISRENSEEFKSLDNNYSNEPKSLIKSEETSIEKEDNYSTEKSFENPSDDSVEKSFEKDENYKGNMNSNEESLINSYEEKIPLEVNDNISSIEKYNGTLEENYDNKGSIENYNLSSLEYYSHIPEEIKNLTSFGNYNWSSNEDYLPIPVEQENITVISVGNDKLNSNEDYLPFPDVKENITSFGNYNLTTNENYLPIPVVQENITSVGNDKLNSNEDYLPFPEIKTNITTFENDKLNSNEHYVPSQEEKENITPLNISTIKFTNDNKKLDENSKENEHSNPFVNQFENHKIDSKENKKSNSFEQDKQTDDIRSNEENFDSPQNKNFSSFDNFNVQTSEKNTNFNENVNPISVEINIKDGNLTVLNPPETINQYVSTISKTTPQSESNERGHFTVLDESDEEEIVTEPTLTIKALGPLIEQNSKFKILYEIAKEKNENKNYNMTNIERMEFRSEREDGDE